MVDAARRETVARVYFDSDPNAEGFYRRMGATTVGDAPSGSVPGCRLPSMEFVL
jgi:hypothetical protein